MSNTGTVLVCGGAGFIGSSLCARFVSDGWQVICADNLATGVTENIDSLRLQGMHFVDWDVCTPAPESIREIVGRSGLDLVMHLACPASPKAYGRMPLFTMRSGSQGTWNLLDLALQFGARFILASTSEVYGDPEVHPQVEDYRGNVSTLSPRAVYDESKRFSEALTWTYHRHHGLDVGIARIFNTYGPGMQIDDGRVISNFIVQALGGGPLTVYGDGAQTRSFCYVTDTVEGLVRLAHSDYREPVNLGNSTEYTICQLAAQVIRATDRDVVLVHEDGVNDDPRRRCPSLARAQRVLGWEPKVELPEGLALTVEWFQQALSRGDS